MTNAYLHMLSHPEDRAIETARLQMGAPSYANASNGLLIKWLTDAAQRYARASVAGNSDDMRHHKKAMEDCEAELLRRLEEATDAEA